MIGFKMTTVSLIEKIENEQNFKMTVISLIKMPNSLKISKRLGYP